MTRGSACARVAGVLCLVATSAASSLAALERAIPVPGAALLASLAARRAQIAHVRVIHLADVVSTFTAISPARLETYPGVRVTRESGPSIDALLAHLRSAGVGEEVTRTIDARWAFVFERSDRSRVGAIYLDEFGRLLTTADRSFRLESSSTLYAWLHARYGRDGVLH